MSKAPKLRFKEFSGDWESKRLNDLCEKIMVGIASSATHAYRTSGIIMFRNQNIKPNHLDDTDILYLDEQYEKTHKSKRLMPGDLLTARTGYPGTTCVVPDKYINAQSFTTLITRPNKDLAISEYLSQYINSDIGTKFFKSVEIGGGQKNVNAETLKSLPISIPSLKEQEKIASFFSLIDDKISLQGEKVEALKDYKRGMMQKIFSRELRFKDDEGRDYPEWEEKKLGDVGIIVTGNTPSTKEKDNYGDEYLWASPADLGYKKVIDDTINKLSFKGFDKIRKVPKGSILATCIGSTIGKIGMASMEMSTNQQINTLICNKDINNEFVYYSLEYNFPRYLSYVTAQAVPIINKTQFQEFDINVPVLDEQIKIGKTLSKIDLKIEKEQEKLDSLNQYKKGLLQQMFV